MDRARSRRSDFKILTGKPTGKRPLGRPRRRWEDIIRIDPKEIGINARNWVYSAQSRDYCGIGPPGFIIHGMSQGVRLIEQELKKLG